MYQSFRHRTEGRKGSRVYAAPIGPVKPIIPEGMIMLLPDDRLAALQLTAVVASRYGVTPRMVFSKQQSRIAQRARAESVRQVHPAMGWSTTETAAFFGLDHSTVCHHLRGPA